VNLKAISAISGTLMLATCSADRVVISDYCQSYSVIKPSRTDTADTLRQIARENAKWRAVCSQAK
jgi:hypothetical protein